MLLTLSYGVELVAAFVISPFWHFKLVFALEVNLPPPSTLIVTGECQTLDNLRRH